MSSPESICGSTGASSDSISGWLWRFRSAFVALTATRDLMATRLYTAQTTILIKNNAPQLYEYTSMDTATNADGAAQWNINNKTEYTLLESRNLANRVILTEGLFANPLFAGAHHPTSVVGRRRKRKTLETMRKLPMV